MQASAVSARRQSLEGLLAMFVMGQREDEREGWPVKPYYKRDLAVAYAPDITPVAALNRLSSWVHHHKVLYRALADSGYTDRQRMFNSVQVELIFRYLGRP